MTVGLFIGTLVAASIVVSLGVAAFFTDPKIYGALGRSIALSWGLVVCLLLAFALFALMNPDPLPGPEPLIPYLRRSLSITALSALLWLPIFLAVFNALARRRNGAGA